MEEFEKVVEKLDTIRQTPEMGLMVKLGMKRPCCRKHFLTHCDLIEKI